MYPAVGRHYPTIVTFHCHPKGETIDYEVRNILFTSHYLYKINEVKIEDEIVYAQVQHSKKTNNIIIDQN